MNFQDEKDSEIVYKVSFNQDSTCLACATSAGFSLFTTEPFRLLVKRKIAGGVREIEMLYRTNILGFVGTGLDPKFPANKVFIYDDSRASCIGELGFSKDLVIGLRLRRDFIIVILSLKICVFYFNDMKIKDEIYTCNNPQGICSVSYYSDPAVLICPATTLGTVRIHYLSRTSSVIITAHRSEIAGIAINRMGSLFATCSTKGTLIRVFDMKGHILHELRRGSEQAHIHSLAFHPRDDFLVCSSDNGTIHVFTLRETKKASSVLDTIRGILPRYFSSHWSVAKVFLGSDILTTFSQDGNSTSIYAANKNKMFKLSVSEKDIPEVRLTDLSVFSRLEKE